MTTPNLGGNSIESFLVNSSEKDAMEQVAKLAFEYMLCKEACTDIPLVDFKTYFGLISPNTPEAERSCIVYLSIVDMHADTTEATEMVVSAPPGVWHRYQS